MKPILHLLFSLLPCCSCLVSADPCSDYSELDSSTRNVNSPGEDYLCDGGWYCCDNIGRGHHPPDWKGDGWYRFTGSAGKKMPDYPPGWSLCGTWRTGWLSGGHPTTQDGEVTRTVYFDDGPLGPENNPTDVKVINCNNNYFVYYLVDTPDCMLGYCGQ